MVALEARLDGHEAGCNDRQNGLLTAISDIKKELGSMKSAAWCIIVALVAWMAVQLYTLEPGRTQPPAAVAAPIAAAPAATPPAAVAPPPAVR